MPYLRIPGIYKIQSKAKPERIYIGSSYSCNTRKQQHFINLKLNKHCNTKLQNHYNKYGSDDLQFMIIEPCLPIFLFIREQYYLDKLTPYFNINKSTEQSSLDIKRSEETKRKISESRKTLFKTERGKELSKEMSDRFKGKKHTKEHNIKISKAITGENNPFYGKNHSLETRKKIQEKRKFQVFSEETRKKISAGLTGRKYSDESIKKMSESRKRWHENNKIIKQAV